MRQRQKRARVDIARRAVQSGIAAALLTWGGTSRGGQVFHLSLDGDLRSLPAREEIAAELGPGATFIPAGAGQAVEPQVGQPALHIAAPDGRWTDQGSIGFSMRLNRTLSSGPKARDSNVRIQLIKTPFFSAALSERVSGLALDLRLSDAKNKEYAARINWSHLNSAQWYHLAFSWNSATGRFDCFLNGCLQERVRFKPWLDSWEPPRPARGRITLGGTGGRDTAPVTAAIDNVTLHDKALDQAALRKAIRGFARIGLAGEGRTEYLGKLNFHTYDLELLYTADFSSPLNVVHEDQLFEDGKRARRPEQHEWVLEGPGRARTEQGALHLESLKPDKNGHIVLWNTRKFPENCLIEFDVTPANPTNGLNIIFFAAQGRGGGDIFDLKQPRREGVFRNYHSGDIDAYHISYWACDKVQGGTPRRTANIRKNHGFQLVSCGTDNIAAAGKGPHIVRLLKYDGRILLETAGKLAAVWIDRGETHGPVLKDGLIGLRQMGHTGRAAYGSLTVYKVSRKKRKPAELPPVPEKKK